jgi:hypothetical protein
MARWVPKIADDVVVEYLKLGLGTRAIQKITGIHVDNVRLRRLREVHGLVRTDWRAVMREHVGNHSNATDLAKAMGIPFGRTLYYLAGILRELRERSALHNCVCGKPAYHQSACNRADKIAGTGFVSDEMITSLLLQGFRRTAIVAKTGVYVTETRISKLCELHRIEKGVKISRQRHRRTQRDQNLGNLLFARVRHALRHMTDPQLKDDAMSEMFLDLSTGKLKADEIVAKARSYSGAAIAEWQSRYGARSLDEVRFKEGDTTVLDTIEDESALEAFDAFVEIEDDMMVGSD